MRNLPRLDKMRILVSLSNIYKIPKLSNLSFFYPIVLGDVCAECALNSRAAIFPFPVVPQRKRKPSEVGSGSGALIFPSKLFGDYRQFAIVEVW